MDAALANAEPRGRAYIRFHDMNADLQRRGAPPGNVIGFNWSEEEAEVQRILTQMRAH